MDQPCHPGHMVKYQKPIAYRMYHTSRALLQSNKMTLIEQIADWDNLLLAYQKARKGKSGINEVERFGANLWLNLGNIQLHLLSGTYQIGTYREFVVYEPKKRQILAAPFRDRVVQHAMLNILEAQWDKRLIDDTYACRKGKGTHQAATRIQHWLKGMAKNQSLENIWIVKTDYSKYFQSLNHDILKQVAAKGIDCQLTLKAIFNIIDSVPSPGMPVGNLLSQWLANLVGNIIDQHVKRNLRVKRYLRYMDDCVAIFGSKIEAQLYFAELSKLSESLELKFSKVSIHRATQGVNMVGYRIWPTHKLLRKRAIVQFKRDIKFIKKHYQNPEQQAKQINKRTKAFIAHSKHADGARLLNKLVNSSFNKAI